jgi:SAM-dependent methyltransferase
MSTPDAKRMVVDHYQQLVRAHGNGPEALGYSSLESQVMRFEQLATIGDLTGARVLDLGCGLGHFYEFLNNRVGHVHYKGIDIVPEMIEAAKGRYPDAAFECRDVLLDPPGEEFDYVLICGVFNNAIPDAGAFLKSLTKTGFERARVALGFNFISSYVNYTDDRFTYHDPIEVLHYCINTLSRKTTMHHHYSRTDVCVFVRK